MNVTNTIHIGKKTQVINGREVEVYIVPALSFQRKDNPNPKKIPHPLGKDFLIFESVEEAQQAIEHSGFTCAMPHTIKRHIEKQTYHTSYDDLILDSLEKLAQDISPNVAASAIFALGEIAHPQTIDLLIQKMGEDNEIIRTNATDAVAKCGMAAFDKLLQALNDENWVKRNSAVICLGKLSDNPEIDIQKMIVPLFKKLDDKNSIVKSSTALTLGKIYKNLKEQQNRRKH